MTSADPSSLAVVTGASSGIGACYADRLAARGHALLLVARRADRLDQLALQLRQRHGVDVRTLVADLERPADLAALEQVLQTQPVSVLVNNAGAGGLGPVATSTPEQLERLIRLNVVALTRLSQAALAGFAARQAGTLVNIGSIIAMAPNQGAAAYSGSKAYVLNFTRSLQMEHAGSPIRIQVVLPGPVRTEFFSSQGLSDSVFSPDSFISADALVDAALAGLDAGEPVTCPTLREDRVWTELEQARMNFLRETMAGQVASRYAVAAPR